MKSSRQVVLSVFQLDLMLYTLTVLPAGDQMVGSFALENLKRTYMSSVTEQNVDILI